MITVDREPQYVKAVIEGAIEKVTALHRLLGEDSPYYPSLANIIEILHQINTEQLVKG